MQPDTKHRLLRIFLAFFVIIPFNLLATVWNLLLAFFWKAQYYTTRIRYKLGLY